MKLGRILTLGAAFMLCGASAAFAGPKTIVTAPALRSVGVSQTIYCDIVNLDSAPQDVLIEVMDYNGNVTATYGFPITIFPNNGFDLNDSFGNGSWCRFTVNASTKKFRGIAIYDNQAGGGDHYTMTIPGY